ncbi:Hypothetical predicted protein [Paramuricea clavata]|uniref:Uncharacterized protein n=1 Tax=Paramuricea clavata TaxID=317549 RepID=A0A6S7J6P2_PARCT|nr:Hypothetical predicted protein [Paramuricea clavata]
MRRSVVKYVADNNVDEVVEHLVNVYRLMYYEDLKGCPSIRFLIVRLCSALGCAVRDCLRDTLPSNDKSKHEFLFYGIIVPHLQIDVSRYIYYRMWADRLKQRLDNDWSAQLSYVGYEWKDWRERWQEHLWRKKMGYNEGLVKCGDSIVVLGENHSGEEFDRIMEALIEINSVIDKIGGVARRPLNKLMIVRVCSKLGIETGVGDAKLENAVLNSEDLLFGKVYPELGWEPSNCKFYGEWLRRKLKEKQVLESMDLEPKLERYLNPGSG